MNSLIKEQLSPNPFKILKNISCFKKILKGFKVSDENTLLDVLMYQPKLIHSCMTKGFNIEDADFFKLSCNVYYNIPLVSSAWFGSEKGYALKQSTKSHSPAPNFEREQLLNFIKTEELPNKIIPIHLEMRQTIDDIESVFTFKINQS